MDIELRAACVPEEMRIRLIGELDPKKTGEVNSIVAHLPAYLVNSRCAQVFTLRQFPAYRHSISMFPNVQCDHFQISIFDFILFTPLWMYLHDGIVDNPFSEQVRVGHVSWDGIVDNPFSEQVRVGW